MFNGSSIGRRVFTAELGTRRAFSRGHGAVRRKRPAGGRGHPRRTPADHPDRRIYRPHSSGGAGSARRPGQRHSSKSGSLSRAPRSSRAICSISLEQPPFQAQVEADKATVRSTGGAAHQCRADARAGADPSWATPAGRNRRSIPRSAPVSGPWRRRSRAPRRSCRTAEINLGYTEIRAPIDGKISSTAVTEGNVVVADEQGPWRRSSARTRCTSLFPIAHAPGLDLRSRYGRRAGSTPS